MENKNFINSRNIIDKSILNNPTNPNTTNTTINSSQLNNFINLGNNLNFTPFNPPNNININNNINNDLNINHDEFYLFLLELSGIARSSSFNSNYILRNISNSERNSNCLNLLIGFYYEKNKKIK